MRLLTWFGTLTEHIFAIGYIGVFLALIVEGLGLPFPGDVVMALYGFAAAKGRFHALPIFLFGTLGYLVGSLLAYALSRTFGLRWLERFPLLPIINRRSMNRTIRLIDRFGPLLLVPGRFLPGVRSVSSYVAGVSKMDFSPFLVYTIIGTSLWCAAWISVGFWFGDHLKSILHTIQSGLMYVTVSLLVTAAIVWLARRRRIRT